MPCIEFEQAAKRFVTPAGAFDALRPLTLSVQEGEYLAITGPSGSGKSTLLNLAGGIDRPSGGRVAVAGEDITAMRETRLAAFRGRRMGFVFQFFQLIPTLSALENVQLAMDLVRVIPARQRRQRAAGLLEAVGLHAHRHKLPAALSGGEQQRVAIARALANDPPILLADEPTGNLDSHNSALVNEIFAECAGEGRTVLVATHDLDEPHRYSRLLRLADGALQADEPVQRRVA